MWPSKRKLPPDVDEIRLLYLSLSADLRWEMWGNADRDLGRLESKGYISPSLAGHIRKRIKEGRLRT